MIAIKKGFIRLNSLEVVSLILVLVLESKSIVLTCLVDRDSALGSIVDVNQGLHLRIYYN